MHVNSTLLSNQCNCFVHSTDTHLNTPFLGTTLSVFFSGEVKRCDEALVAAEDVLAADELSVGVEPVVVTLAGKATL